VLSKRGAPAHIILAVFLSVIAITAVAGQLNRAWADTFGKTSVGALADEGMFANYKIVHKATMSAAGAVTKLSLYAIPGINSPKAQSLKAVIYTDSSGSPGALLATGTEVTYRGNVNGSGWLELPFSSPVALTAGTYWLGFIDGAETEGMGYVYDEVSNSRAYNTNTFSSGPTNPFGSATKDSEQASIYATYTPAPTNTSPPTITGTAQQGQTLTEHHGSWTHEPTSYSYRWEQCNSLGEGCLPVSGATSQTYVSVAGDVGHTLKVQETASNASGSGSTASAATAAVTPPPPTNTAPPTIAGAAEQGLTLTETHGSWTHEPTSYSYQWRQCDSVGGSCTNISGATSQTYVPVAGDVGHTIRVQETATNSGGSSEPATSAASAVVLATFGKTSVGASYDNGMFANYKIVHTTTLSGTGSISKLSLYAIPGSKSPAPQALKAVIYADSEGSPGALLATGTEVTYRGNINDSGWLELPFGSPVALTAGTYWLGFIDGTESEGMGYVYDEVSNSRAYNTNTYGSGPTNPFGSATKDSEQASIFATYTLSSAPANTSPPTITGIAQEGHTLTEHHGSWTHEPTSYSYQWRQCNSAGNSCTSISGATSQTYVPVSGDIGHTLRVEETATNASGSGRTASAARAVVACTDTWTGPSEASWQIATDWSAEHVPTFTDVACIGAGKTVKINEGSNQAGVVQGEGTLELASGSLEVSDTLESSRLAGLNLDGGTLTGAATVDVTGLFNSASGIMRGSGTIVIVSGATATLGDTWLEEGRVLLNEGTATYSSGDFTLAGGAKLKNVGTFKANAEASTPDFRTGSGGGAIVNTGLFEKTSGTGPMEIGVPFENQGTLKGESAAIRFTSAAEATLGSSVLEGKIENFGTTTAANLKASNATLMLFGGSLSVTSGSSAVIGNLEQSGVGLGVLTGAGTVEVSGSLTTTSGAMRGSGTTVILPGATATLRDIWLEEGRVLLNEGTATFRSPGDFTMSDNARLLNEGTFKINSEGSPPVFRVGASGGGPLIVNNGVFEKTEGTGVSEVGVHFANFGSIVEETGTIRFIEPELAEPSTQWGEENPSSANPEQPECGEGVSCATGNFSETQTDFAIAGRGVGLDLTRTYNSQAAVAAAKAKKPGMFGYGWSSSFGDRLEAEPANKAARLIQANGSQVVFSEATGGTFTAPAWSQDTLTGSKEAGYTLTLENQTVYKFAGTTGRLESVTDRNANATTLTYNEVGQLTTITDPASRTIKLTYNAGGMVESAEDPMKHVVKYAYESENLKSVTQPGESALSWQFKYDASHQLTEVTDGRNNTAKNEYNGVNEVIKQTDRLGRVTTFEYKPFLTKTTNAATGSITATQLTSADQANAITHGYGTSLATTESKTYDPAGDALSQTDGNGHTTKYTYDGHANRTSMVDPVGNEAKWTYDSTHDVETETKPNGEKTTYKRDSHGNPEVIERPAPGKTTQSTSYKYDSHGDVESMTDPLKRTWKYEYDSAGDKTAEIDPEGDKRTWGYNEDSQETSMVSPKGHVEGAEEATYKTTTERDAQGRPIKVTDPLGHETKTKYDGDGNIEVKTDPEGHKTAYTYNADNEQTKVKEPNGALAETGYDGAGQVTSHTDANKHTTKYERNVLEQVAEVVDPLGHRAIKEYDDAGNLAKLTDPLKRSATYRYDAVNHLIEVSYSDGKTHADTYEYNKDGDRTKMTDGSGTTTYEYDELDRLTETKNGHGDTVGYEYDLANEQTKITYPNTKAVTREYDNAGRLKKVTDWSEHATKFAYDVDGNLKATAFPSGTSNEDTYAYDTTDAMKEVKMAKGAETLASLVYTRNKDGQVEGVTSKGLPGEEKPAYTYDVNRRLEKGGPTGYKYDEANNPTEIGGLTYSYDAADEPEKAKEGGTTKASYTYDEVGERTRTTPSTGPATSYGYDEAGRLTSVERPKEGETQAIEDTYAYNGDGLRMSQTISKTTSFMAWDTSGRLPLILNDGANSYLYGPGGLPIEQINGEGKVVYLHHDQQGSTRLLTGPTGALEGSVTYDAYGGAAASTGSVHTPLGYAGQYTDSDTGLIYLRARFYDPVTAQFLTVDPADEQTLAPYTYALDDPLSRGDPSGLCVVASAAGYRAPNEGDCQKKRGNIEYLLIDLNAQLVAIKLNPRGTLEEEVKHKKAFEQGRNKLKQLVKKYRNTGCERKFPHLRLEWESVKEIEEEPLRIRIVAA